MSRKQAEEAVKHMLISGYGHYSRADEHKVITAFLQGSQIQPADVLMKDLQFSVDAMNDFPLAVQPLRGIKNSLICLVAVICRYAADLGADDERCYALSDYYINEIETRVDKNNWNEVFSEIINHYIKLVGLGREGKYSLTIRRAINFINQHIYEACSLKDVSLALKVHPNYLSALFKTETGVSLSHYIRDKKISEARNLLRDTDYSISEISEMLGYNSLSYFSKVFHQICSCSPKEYLTNHNLFIPLKDN